MFKKFKEFIFAVFIFYILPAFICWAEILWFLELEDKSATIGDSFVVICPMVNIVSSVVLFFTILAKLIGPFLF